MISSLLFLILVIYVFIFLLLYWLDVYQFYWPFQRTKLIFFIDFLFSMSLVYFLIFIISFSLLTVYWIYSWFLQFPLVKALIIDFRSFFFCNMFIQSYKFPSENYFCWSYKFLSVVFSFSTKYYLIPLESFSLTRVLFRSVFLISRYFGIFQSSFWFWYLVFDI